MKTICLLFTLLVLSSCFSEEPLTKNLIDTIVHDIEDSKKTVQDPRTDTIEFIEGFLDGVGATKVYHQIQSCIDDSETFLVDLGVGIKDLETKDSEKVREGIRLLGQASKIVTQAAKECKVARADIDQIAKLIRSFTNPMSFIYYAEKSLLINRVEVLKEVMKAMIAYQNQDYQQVGYWIGKAMDSIFFKSAPSIGDTKADVVAFISGFLEGVGITDVFNQIQGCIGDSEQFFTDLAVGIEDFETKDPERVREGIRVLGEAAKIIPEAAKACKTADADIERIIKMIKTFTNPVSFVYDVGKSLVIDRVEVFNDVVRAVLAYEKQDYKNVGYWVGEAMAHIFLNSPLYNSDEINECTGNSEKNVAPVLEMAFLPKLRI